MENKKSIYLVQPLESRTDTVCSLSTHTLGLQRLFLALSEFEHATLC